MAKRTWITVKRGILEPKHREQIGPAIWLYLYILDRANWEQGAVLEWIDANAADDLEFDLNTLRSHRRRLEEYGYITCQKKQHSQKIHINNWTNPREYSGKTYNQTPKTQSVVDGELSEKVESGSQSVNQSSSQSGSQPIHKPTTPTSNSKIKNQKSTTGAGNEIRAYAQERFEYYTGLRVPPDKGEAGKRWWTPLREFITLSGDDPRKVDVLIRACVDHFRKENLTYDSPASMIKKARHLASQAQGVPQ